MAEIFRKKAIERVASPDRLDDYIAVSNPSVWIILGAIVAFLIGVCVWIVLGHIEDVQPAVIRVSDGEAVLYMDKASAGDLDVGDSVKVADVEGRVMAVQDEEVSASTLDSGEAHALGLKSGSLAVAKVSIDLPDGSYEGRVTVSELDPLDLLLSRS